MFASLSQLQMVNETHIAKQSLQEPSQLMSVWHSLSISLAKISWQLSALTVHWVALINGTGPPVCLNDVNSVLLTTTKQSK